MIGRPVREYIKCITLAGLFSLGHRKIPAILKKR